MAITKTRRATTPPVAAVPAYTEPSEAPTVDFFAGSPRVWRSRLRNPQEGLGRHAFEALMAGDPTALPEAAREMNRRLQDFRPAMKFEDWLKISDKTNLVWSARRAEDGGLVAGLLKQFWEQHDALEFQED